MLESECSDAEKMLRSGFEFPPAASERTPSLSELFERCFFTDSSLLELQECFSFFTVIVFLYSSLSLPEESRVRLLSFGGSSASLSLLEFSFE